MTDVSPTFDSLSQPSFVLIPIAVNDPVSLLDGEFSNTKSYLVVVGIFGPDQNISIVTLG